MPITCSFNGYLEIELNHIEDWKLEEKKRRSLQFITAVEPPLPGDGITTKKVFPKGENVKQLQGEITSCSPHLKNFMSPRCWIHNSIFYS